MATSKAKDDFSLTESFTSSNGQFSDFTILSDGEEFDVHRCFIAPQSRYFERCCAGMFKEGAERKIDLKEDQPGMVERMMYYFYNFDYNCNLSAGGDDKQKPPSIDLQLKTHVHIFCIADKYDVPGLKALTIEKFKGALHIALLSSTEMALVTYELAKADLPESVATLRDLLVDAWLLGGSALFTPLITNQPKEFARLMTTAPWLSFGLHARTLPSLKFVHVAKQAVRERVASQVLHRPPI